MLPAVNILNTPSGKYMVWGGVDVLGQILLRDGIHEEPVLNLSKFIIKNSAADKPFILDIGANIGSYSIPLALEFKDKIKISSFEVQKDIYHQLCGNIFLNSISCIKSYNLAIGSKCGTLKIPEIDYSKCSNVGGYSVDSLPQSVNRIDFPNDSITGMIECEMVTIDSIVHNEIVDLIKLDVEGYELEVLKGMHNLLEKSKYPPIIFEAWPFEWYAEKKQELVNYFHSIGYTNISPDIGYNNYLAQHLSNKNSHLKFHSINGIMNVSL